MKSIRSILHILLGVTLICSCNEATELAHITPNVSLIKYKDIVKIDSLYTYPGDSLYQNWINQYNKNLEDKTSRSLSPEDDAAGQETSGDDESKTEEQVSDSDTIYPEKTTRAIVDCDGALNLRRSASWGNESICGRAVRGQSYYIKAIHTVEGKKMLETIDGIFLSGQPEHVRIIEV